MKNFFKKLSFVMALAMIVTALAPASGVFAAATPKLNKSLVYLHVAEGTTEFDFNIANKKDGWKYKWTSSNEDVAEVNAKNGLTEAVGKGTATISVVISDKAGERVKKLSAKVVVRDNIKKLTIYSNKAAGTSINVGEKVDFNRKYTTASGSTTKTSGITRWEVAGTGGAIVANSGLFSSEKAGKFTITARAFQSTAKYNAWLTDKAKYAKYVTATATTDVTVAANMKEVKQTDLDSFQVTFDTVITDASTKLAVVYMVGTTEVVAPISKVTMDTTGKIATVDMYTTFVKGSTYLVKYPDMVNGQFVAATANVADVKTVKVTTTEVQLNKLTEVKVAILNAAGVDLGADSDLKNRVTLESSNANVSWSDKKIQLFNVGDTTEITATFHPRTYDATTGAETGTIVGKGTVTCVAEIKDVPSGIKAYTVAKTADGPGNYTNVNKQLAIGDTEYSLYVQLNIDAEPTTDDYDVKSNVAGFGTTAFEFSSSNTNILLLGATGQLIPVAEGTAYVVIKYKEKDAGTVAVTVGPRRAVTTVTLDNYSFTLSNDATVFDNKTVAVSVKDQYGKVMNTSKYTVADVERTTTATGGTGSALTGTKTTPANNTTDPYKFNFEGTNCATGTNVYKVTVTDSTSLAKSYVYATVSVDDPTNQTVVGYKIETDGASYDMHLGQTNGDLDQTAKVEIFGVAADGTKNVRFVTRTEDASAAAIAANEPYLVISAAGSNAYTKTSGTDANSTSSAAVIGFITNDTTTAAKRAKASKGTWVVKAVTGTAQAVLASTTFNLVDTTDVPAVTVAKTYKDREGTDGTTLTLDYLEDCFDVSFNGAALDFAGNIALSDVETADGLYTNASGTYFIKKIHYKEYLKNSAGAVTAQYVDHAVDVNVTITCK